MLTSKKPHFFSEIKNQEHKINLNESIREFGYKIDVIANEIYNLAGGTEQKNIFLRSPKKKKNNDKNKKNLVEIFNERAKRKRIIGPYLKGTCKIDDHLKLLKNILNDDEGTRLDFIKKKKRQDEILKRLDENYLKNQEIRKKAKEISLKEDISLKSGDFIEGFQNIRDILPKRSSIFDFHKQFSLISENNIKEIDHKNNNHNRISKRKNSEKMGTMNSIKNITNLRENKKNDTLEQIVKNDSEEFSNYNNNYVQNRKLSISSKTDDKGLDLEKNLNNIKNVGLNSTINNFFSINNSRNVSHNDFKPNFRNVDTIDNSSKLNRRNYPRQTIVVKNSNTKIDNMSNINSSYLPLINNKETLDSNKTIDIPSCLNFKNNFIEVKDKESFLNHNDNPINGNFNSNTIIEDTTDENDYINIKYYSNPTNDYFHFKNNSLKNNKKSGYLQENFITKNDSENDVYYSNVLQNKDMYSTISTDNKNQNYFSGMNFFNSLSSPKRDNKNNYTSLNFFTSNKDINEIHISTIDKKSNKRIINISSTDISDLNQNTSTANRNITTKNQFNKSIMPKTKNKIIEDRIAHFCTDTSNRAKAIKNTIENYSPIHKNIIKNRQKIDKKYLKPELEKDIEKENQDFRKSKGFFIYPKSLLKPVYVSENNKNVLRESNYVDRLNETKAFAARNLIYNKYKVHINNKDLYNYKSDIRPEKTHKDYIENFKQNKIRNNSFNIQKLIVNTKVIKREINDKFEEMKVNKIVSNSVNKLKC